MPLPLALIPLLVATALAIDSRIKSMPEASFADGKEADRDVEDFAHDLGKHLHLMQGVASQILGARGLDVKGSHAGQVLRRVSRQLNVSAAILNQWAPAYAQHYGTQQVGQELAEQSDAWEIAQLKRQLSQEIQNGQTQDYARQQKIASLTQGNKALLARLQSPEHTLVMKEQPSPGVSSSGEAPLRPPSRPQRQANAAEHHLTAFQHLRRASGLLRRMSGISKGHRGHV